MYEIIFVVLGVGVMALAWWWLKQRRRELLGGSGGPPEDAGWPAEPQTFTRDALVNRSREFDPSAWDDSPEPSASAAKPAAARPAPSRPAPARPRPAAARPEDDEDEAPAYFDREFLERQRRQRAIDTGTDLPPSDQ